MCFIMIVYKAAELDDAQMFAHFSGEAVTPGTTYMAAFVP